jgi:uncharacterized RDD family membrane protein YckC
MGIVYQAEELSSGRAVALKVLAASTEVSEEAFERFRRESRMAASISDPHCVFVYGAHQVDGRPAIAMELCPGETLEHRISKGKPIPIEIAVRWTLEILDGLEAASRAGVVHRDVKPSNCFITEGEGVKVGDFGLSRSLDTDIQLTQSGAFLGSPLYASPEQVRGREVDQRSDIYSCGATLYALLSGHAPFLGANLGEVLARILSEKPRPLRSLRRDVPPALEKAVQKAMEREADRRFPDHAAFRAALEPFVAEEAPPAGRTLRAMAYVLDWVLVDAVSSGILMLGTSVGWSAFEMDRSQPGRLISVVTTLLLHSLPAVYFALGEGLFGRTLARWLLGQRVVDARMLRPSFPRALLRALVWFGPGFLQVAWLHGMQMDQDELGYGSAAFTAAQYLLFASSMRRRNGFRGLQDFASGMRVVQSRSPFVRAKSARPVPVRPSSVRGEHPVALGAYRIEGTIGSTPSGTVLTGADASLGRPVWILQHRNPANAASESRRSLARSGRLRWLDALRVEDVLFEVFESPGGASVRECVDRGASFDWPAAQRVLAALAEELAALPASSRVSIEQVWIDRTWNPRLLDEPMEEPSSGSKSPLELLGEAARLVLTDLAELPLSAEPAVRKLLGQGPGFSSVEEARRELKELARRPMRLASPVRAAQIAVASIAPAAVLALVIVPLFLLAGPIDSFAETVRCIRQLEVQDRIPPPAEKMEAEDRAAREIVLSAGSASPWSATFASRLQPAQIEIRRRAIEAHPSPSADEVAQARERIRERPFLAGDLSGTSEVNFRGVRRQIIPIITAGVVAGWGVLCTLFAVLLRGGLSFNLFGMGLRDARGERASRLRCAGRSLSVWLPLAVPYGLGCWLALNDHAEAGLAFFFGGTLFHALALAYAIARPSRGLQDRLARTWLVPR